MFRVSVIEKPLRSGAVRYVVRWRPAGAGGPQPAVPFTDETDARLFASLVERHQAVPDAAVLTAVGLGFLVGQYAPPSTPDPAPPAGPASPTLVDACTAYLDTLDVQGDTLDGYRGMVRNHLAPHFGPMPLVDVHEAQLRAWQAWMTSRGRTDKTINNVRGSILNAVFERAMHRGPHGEPPLRDYNPLRQVAAPGRGKRKGRRIGARKRDIVTGDEGAVFFRAAYATDPDVADLLFTAAGTGQRFAELAALRVDAVDLDAGLLDVFRVLRRQAAAVTGGRGPRRPQGTGRSFEIVEDTKTEAGDRLIPIPDPVLPVIAARIAGKAPDALVFTNPATGEQWHRTSWQRRMTKVKKAAAAAGVTRTITAHSMRHLYTSLIANANVDPVTLASVLGHDSASVSYGVYTHVLNTGHALVRAAVADTLAALRPTAA